MKKKVIILGSMGMLGHVVYQIFKQSGYDVIGIARSKGAYCDHTLDVSQFAQLESYLKEKNADYIINCVGVLVQQSAQNIQNSILLNSYLPHFLASVCRKINARLIHISTDCVFSGKSGGYCETDTCDGDTPYARTKILGEVKNDLDLTIRTSIIGGELKKNGTGLLHWFLTQHKNSTIYGYKNAFWSGVTTLELAKIIDQLIQQEITGLYHITAPNKISKYNLLKLFKEVWHKELTILPNDQIVIDKSLIDTRKELSYTIQDYPVMLQQLKEWMEIHKKDYYYNNGNAE